MDENKTNAKVGIVIPARNEEKNIQKTLTSLLNQKLKPNEIIVVNDGSTDNTKSVVESFKEVKIVDFPFKHGNWVGKKELADVFNTGLTKLNDENDYIMILGSDHSLPPNYLLDLTKSMSIDKKVVVASGIIEDESYNLPRGSGRIIKRKFWNLIGKKLPVNVGFETYVCLKALSLDYEVKVYEKIVSKINRKTKNTYKPFLSFRTGQAMRAMGFPWGHLVSYSLFLLKNKRIKNTFYFLLGYISNFNLRYEKELREYANKKYGNLDKKIIKKLNHILTQK